MMICPVFNHGAFQIELQSVWRSQVACYVFHQAQTFKLSSSYQGIIRKNFRDFTQVMVFGIGTFPELLEPVWHFSRNFGSVLTEVRHWSSITSLFFSHILFTYLLHYVSILFDLSWEGDRGRYLNESVRIQAMFCIAIRGLGQIWFRIYW